MSSTNPYAGEYANIMSGVRKLYPCPAYKRGIVLTNALYFGQLAALSYGFNGWGCSLKELRSLDDGCPDPPVTETEVLAPSDMIAYGDAPEAQGFFAFVFMPIFGTDWGKGFEGYGPAKRHNGGASPMGKARSRIRRESRSRSGRIGATGGKVGSCGVPFVTQPAGADQAAVTVTNTDGEIAGLTISDPPTQAEVQDLRDKAGEWTDDLSNHSTLSHSLRTALVTGGLVKGGAHLAAHNRGQKQIAISFFMALEIVITLHAQWLLGRHQDD